MQHAQPSIAAVSLAHLALLEALGVEADMTGGHSFGEIMALHYAGAFDREAALTIAAARGREMAKAAETTEGAMLAVQCPASRIAPLVKEIGGGLVIANDNGPSQVVLSGPVSVVQQAEQRCTAEGIKARRLPVATAFHSAIVEPAVAPFRSTLEGLKLKRPSLPVYANATAQPYKATAKELAGALASQIASPVLFREQVEAMYAAGVRIFIEVGPGNVVAGLVSDTLGDRDYTVLSLDNKRTNGVSQFLGSLGALAVSGFKLDLASLYADAPAPVPKSPPSKHAVFLTGANYDRPYPPKDGAAGRAPPNAVATVNLSPTPQSPSPAQRTEPPMPDQNGRHPVAAPPSPVAQTAGRVEITSPVERIWQEVSNQHQNYLNAIADGHKAYLNAAAVLLGQAGGIQTEPQLLAAPRAAAPQPAPQPVFAPPPAPAPAEAPKPKVNGSGGAHAFVPEPVKAPAAPAPVVAEPARKPSSASTSALDSAAIVRSIVSEKTGYPPDMLDADMDLEGELGVDSIKQVEILSSLRDRLPHLPEIEPERLVELRTIAAIAAMIDAAAPGGSSSPAPAAPARAETKAVTAPAASSLLVSPDVIRALIAEKTGYPTDMLEDDMDLEGELGVDSIKQVEILSSLRDKYPSLPEVDPEHLAELRTIRKIADFFG